MEYGVRAVNYLARAQEQIPSGNPEALFYAAMELRCGIEARLHEYRDSVRAKKRDNTWQVRLLKRDIDTRAHKYERPFTLHFRSTTTGEKYPVRYVPISTELNSIAERLGDYLHCVNSTKVQQPRYWSEFRNIVKRGITLLSEAVSGDLLSAITWDDKEKIAVLKFDEGKMPPFFTLGEKTSFVAKWVVVSKDEKGIRVRPAEDG